MRLICILVLFLSIFLLNNCKKENPSEPVTRFIIEPSSLYFTKINNRDTLLITNKDNQQLSWRLSSIPGWLSLTKDSGRVGLQKDTVIMVADIKQKVGFYNGKLEFTSNMGDLNIPSSLEIDSIPYSASVTDIVHYNSKIYIATEYGLACTANGGLDWELYYGSGSLPQGGISALYSNNNEILAAGMIISSDSLQRGTGLSYSNDGLNWTFIDQPVDSAYANTVQNIIYDIAMRNNEIWIASFAGGLKKSTDRGSTWLTVTIDGQYPDPFNNLRHRVFSVLTANNELWVGTAAGIGRSQDDGQIWQLFQYRSGQSSISGNYVIVLAYQENNNTIWASTIEAVNPQETRAISRTFNGGMTWEVLHEGIFTYDIFVNEDNIYLAADEGLFISHDLGSTWHIIDRIYDINSGLLLDNTPFLSAFSEADSNSSGYGLWIGCRNGLAHSTDNGNSWKIIEIPKDN